MRRFHEPAESALMARRRRFARAFGIETRQHHRKRHPRDCGVTQCGTCHGERYPKRDLTRREVAAESDLREWADAMPTEGPNITIIGP
jgi:hypothetical protein